MIWGYHYFRKHPIGVMTLPHKNTGSPPSLIRFFLPTECSSWWFFRKLHRKWWGATIRGFPKIGVPPKHPKMIARSAFFWRRPPVSSGGLAPGPTPASACPSKQKDTSHELGLTEPERYQQKPISAQIKGTAHPTCNWPRGVCSPLSAALRAFLAFACFFWLRAFAWQGGMRSRHSEGDRIFWFMAYVPWSLWSIFAPETWGAVPQLWLWQPSSASQCFSYVVGNRRTTGMSDVSLWGVGLFTSFCGLTRKARICNQCAIRDRNRFREAGSQLSSLTSVAERVRLAFHLQSKLKAGWVSQEIFPESPPPRSLAVWWSRRGLARHLTDKIWGRHSCTVCGNPQWCVKVNSSLHRVRFLPLCLSVGRTQLQAIRHCESALCLKDRRMMSDVFLDCSYGIPSRLEAITRVTRACRSRSCQSRTG